MRTERLDNDRNTYRIHCDSVGELAALAAKHLDTDDTRMLQRNFDRSFIGTSSASAALKLAASGWDDNLPETLAVAERAIARVESEHTVPAFLPAFDVTGCEVDVARYLDDEPECMVDYPLTEIVKAGRIITICAATAVSAAVDQASITRRGRIATALALSLERLGYGVEIIADWAASGESYAKGTVPDVNIRTVVKSAHDETDASRIMYALAHPSMTRVLSFLAAHDMPKDAQRAANIGRNYGYPLDAIRDLPDGTIYLPCMASEVDIPDADQALLDYLRQLEIVTD